MPPSALDSLARHCYFFTGFLAFFFGAGLGGLLLTFPATDQTHSIGRIEGELPDRSFGLARLSSE